MVMQNIKKRKLNINVCPAYSANVNEMTVTPATKIKVRRTENKDRRVTCSHRSTDMSVMMSIVVEEKNTLLLFRTFSIIPFIAGFASISPNWISSFTI